MKSDLPDRTFAFAERIVRLCVFLEQNGEYQRRSRHNCYAPVHQLEPTLKKPVQQRVARTSFTSMR